MKVTIRWLENVFIVRSRTDITIDVYSNHLTIPYITQALLAGTTNNIVNNDNIDTPSLVVLKGAGFKRLTPAARGIFCKKYPKIICETNLQKVTNF